MIHSTFGTRIRNSAIDSHYQGIKRQAVSTINTFICLADDSFSQSGQALLPPLTLRQKGLVPATTALRACATSTPLSSAQQTFQSGLWPAVKDCFGLNGHSAFGSVANKEIGVGRKSATSVDLTTDLIHWLQAGKTVDISRCASESTDLLPPSALPRSLRSLRLCPPARRCRLW